MNLFHFMEKNKIDNNINRKWTINVAIEMVKIIQIITAISFNLYWKKTFINWQGKLLLSI